MSNDNSIAALLGKKTSLQNIFLDGCYDFCGGVSMSYSSDSVSPAQ